MGIMRNLKICIILIFLTVANAYKPVVILHGVMAGAESMMILEKEIMLNHPGTKIYNCDKFSGWWSLEDAWKQVTEIREYLKEIMNFHPGGVNFIGYSQGGLLARAVLQSCPDHNVNNFISLSSPQAGQYGTSFLQQIFPDLAAETVYKLFYSDLGQRISIGNYWNDPLQHDLYLKYSVFLPFINNEINSANSTQFKNSLLKLNKMVLIGGPKDEVITPWQSSHFGFFNESLNVIPLEETDIFLKDRIGLKSLKNADKLILVTKPDVSHTMWHTTPKVIREVILPYLD